MLQRVPYRAAVSILYPVPIPGNGSHPGLLILALVVCLITIDLSYNLYRVVAQSDSTQALISSVTISVKVTPIDNNNK